MAVWVDCTSRGGFLLNGWAAFLGDWTGEWPQGYPMVLDGLAEFDRVEFWVALENNAHPGDPFYLADGSYGTPVWKTSTRVPGAGADPSTSASWFGSGGAPTPGYGEPPSPAGDWKFWVVVYKADSGAWVEPSFPPEHYVPADYAAAGTAGPNPWHWSEWHDGYMVEVRTSGQLSGTSWNPNDRSDIGFGYNSDLQGTAEGWWAEIIGETVPGGGGGVLAGPGFRWGAGDYLPAPIPPFGWSATLETAQAAISLRLPSPPPPTLPDGMETPPQAPFHGYVPDWQPGMTNPPPAQAQWWSWETSPVGVPGVADYEWDRIPFQAIGYDVSNPLLPNAFDSEPSGLWEIWCYDDSQSGENRSQAGASHVGPGGQGPVGSALVRQSDAPAGTFGIQNMASLAGFGLATTFTAVTGLHESFTGEFPAEACPGISLPGGEDGWTVGFAFAEEIPLAEAPDPTTIENMAYAVIQTCRWRYWVGPHLQTGGGLFWTPGDVQVYGKPAGQWIVVERQAESIGDMLAP
jgi:hypothetical protein